MTDGCGFINGSALRISVFLILYWLGVCTYPDPL